MAGTAVASFLLECHISVSQEEALANLGGGWERSGLYSLDDTPSQSFLPSSPPGAQPNSVTLRAEPPSSYDGGSASESSESLDVEGDTACTQEPVEWISPPSSLQQATVGAEENEQEVAEEEGKEDSYVAAFESDRSRSPSQDWDGQAEEEPGLEVQIPNVGVSAEFLTQPASGIIDSQFTSTENLEIRIRRRETTSPDVEYRVLRQSSSLLPPIAENAASCVVGADVAAMELSLQPFTQPAAGDGLELSLQPFTQPDAGDGMELRLRLFTQPAAESQLLESLNKIQEPASHTHSGGERTETAHPTTLLDQEIAGVDEPEEPVQQGSGRDEGSPALDNDNRCAGEQMPPERGDGISSHSQQLVDDGKDLRPTTQEHNSHSAIEGTPYVEVQRGDSGPSCEPHPASQTSDAVELRVRRTPPASAQGELMQRSNGVTRSSSEASKRASRADDLVDDGKDLRPTMQEHDSHITIEDTPYVEVQRGDLGPSCEPHPASQTCDAVELRVRRTPPDSDQGELMQRCNRVTRSSSKASKRASRVDELHGLQQKRQRTEAASSVTVRSHPDTVTDVARTRSRSLFDSPEDDECSNRNTWSFPKASKLARGDDELHGRQQKRHRTVGSPERVGRHPNPIMDVERCSRCSILLSDSSEDDECRNGDPRSSLKALKRGSRADERHGQQKPRRTEASPVRVRRLSTPVMDVARSRSRSLPESPKDDECSNRNPRSSSKASKRANRTDERHGRQQKRQRTEASPRADEQHGREKRQRTEASPVRVRSHSKTVKDIARSRSRSLSESDDDECCILTILMRAGVSFHPLVYEKHSV